MLATAAVAPAAAPSSPRGARRSRRSASASSRCTIRVPTATSGGERVAESPSSSSSEVFVCAIPLVGMEPLADALEDAYPARLEHTMLLVRHRGETACVAYDFLPIEPTSPATAATLLSGGAVRGDRRVRALSRVPSRRCWRVGDTTPGLGGGGAAGVDAVARAFQSTYDASLRLRENGCREHTAAMALAMTGITLDLDALLIEGDANRSDDDA